MNVERKDIPICHSKSYANKTMSTRICESECENNTCIFKQIHNIRESGGLLSH